MKLLTHNLMQSHVKDVKNGYPLILEVASKKINEIEYNPDFITRMLEKVDWPVLRAAASVCFQEEPEKLNSIPESLPSEASAGYPEEFLRMAHHLMMEVEVQEGFLVCPESKRKFKITRGIPNMLLTGPETK